MLYETRYLYTEYVATTVYARADIYNKNKGRTHRKKRVWSFRWKLLLWLYNSKTSIFLQYGSIFIADAHMGLQHTGTVMEQ